MASNAELQNRVDTLEYQLQAIRNVLEPWIKQEQTVVYKSTFTLEEIHKSNLQIAPRTRVTLVNPVCRVYGKFNENLSVVCDDLQVIPAKS